MLVVIHGWQEYDNIFANLNLLLLPPKRSSIQKKYKKTRKVISNNQKQFTLFSPERATYRSLWRSRKAVLFDAI